MVYVRKFESHVQIANQYAPWKNANGAKPEGIVKGPLEVSVKRLNREPMGANETISMEKYLQKKTVR
jgi:hypothetical protein